MIGECKETEAHCPVCSTELSKLESELLFERGCLFHVSKSRRASIVYTALQGVLDAIIYNTKRRIAKKNIESLDLIIGYNRALVNAGVLDYRNLITLKQKFKLLIGLYKIKPIKGLDE